MRRTTLVTLTALAGARGGLAGTTIWATPHDSYSSSIGVLGCKIDTDRVAYWPDSVSCSNICVSVSYAGRSVKLLRVDQSQGAYDMSYDAWNYLYTGESALDNPTAGGAVEMEYEDLDAGECADLIHTDDSKLPLSASNSMNFLASCLEAESGDDNWVGDNYVLYNILDSICSWGYDEECTLDWPSANQATCANPLGTPVTLTSEPVYNILYPSGQKVLASTGQQVSDSAQNGNSGSGFAIPDSRWLTALATLMSLLSLSG
ncbi:hypothetical protein PFICI_14366 [Pestalotiopsis fici W106-1]|uniref:Cerato-platanin n=1 Tax=Pestalotiopsis fici (strain W106-1 / CGMCC3.15140) TaxID=1229662 RepID=W3WKP4_PESFW|nr:uncharacterized protein PFICI_14366 [Pestalotiopsis fici W106-1]ETS74500.1 hypothetical protein PFICI_14366 [Pestalotiopsis fici W106-1]